MKRLIVLLVFLLPLITTAQKDAKEINEFVSQIDENIPQLLNDFIVPGASIALI